MSIVGVVIMLFPEVVPFKFRSVSDRIVIVVRKQVSSRDLNLVLATLASCRIDWYIHLSLCWHHTGLIGMLLAMLAWYKVDWHSARFACIVCLYVRKKEATDREIYRQKPNINNSITSPQDLNSVLPFLAWYGMIGMLLAMLTWCRVN